MSFQSPANWPDTDTIETEARRILRRLAEPGACLAVAEGMDNAVVVREASDGQTLRTGTVSTTIAEAMSLKGWIAAGSTGRVLRYRITGEGRSALKSLLAEKESARVRFETEEDTPSRASRYGIPESPLLMLARRREKDGSRFLSPELVRAGERLREDYEIAAMAGNPDGGWEALSQSGATSDPNAPGAEGATARLSAAMADLGPGLGDVVLRVCCKLEGLEATEQRMGWAARSGKIVLRIGLQRLARHFAEHSPVGGGLIG